jgi:hypothetical protein
MDGRGALPAARPGADNPCSISPPACALSVLTAMHRFVVRSLSLAVFGVTLAACGGGGDSGPAAPPVSGRCSGAPSFLVGDSNAPAGKTVGAVVGSCGAALTEVAWTQVGGPASVTLLSATTPAIGFDAPAAGAYQFAVTYRIGNAAPRTDNVSVTVSAPAAAPASSITARVDQAVRKGGKASVRAWDTLGAGDSVQSISWSQIEGPAVALDTSDPRRIIFTAPEVSTDTLLRFRVTLRTTGGVSDSDDVMVLVENVAQAPSDPNNSGPYVFSDSHVSRVHAYKRASPFAADLARCTYDPALQWTGAGANLCPLAQMPFLHQTSGGGVPTTAQIMDRVLVSHDWMGRNFEDFLNSASASDDLKRLFNGVTAIVIGAHVRPSFYYALTGAIYLDADNFWLTPSERDVVDEAPDFRSDFGRDLQFSTPWRYAFNNQNIFINFAANSRLSRSLDYLLNEAGWLMYHELGHAADFLPPAVRSTLNPALSAWENIAPRFAARQLPSDMLASTLPLQSAEMRALAQVMFISGPAASDATLVNGIPYGTLTGYSATQVGAFFAGDRASDTYNYATTREDITMLLEEFLQQRNHGFKRDVAITDKITSTTTSNTLIVRWGQRGRVGETSVKPRVDQVVAALAPWVLTADANAVANLPAPIPMRPGESWAANLCLPSPCASPSVQALSIQPFDAAADRALLMRAIRAPGVAVEQARAGGAVAGHWTPNERILRRVRGAR